MYQEPQWRREIDEQFSCDHERWEYRYKLASNGVRHYRKQCLRCGDPRTIRKAEIPTALIDALPEFDEELQESWWQARHQAIQDGYEHHKAVENAEWWRRYNAYLATPQWRRRREKVLKRSGGLCEGCWEARAEQVHHLTYERVGREMLFDLVTVCTVCHEQIHPHMERHPVTVLETP